MNSKYSTLALAVILATGLAACDKNHPKSIKAQAEVAKASDSREKMTEVYERAEALINAEETKLGEKGLKFGLAGSIKQFLLGVVKKEDRSEARKSLNAIVEHAETQIGLAKKLTDDVKLEHSEKTKADALTALDKINGEIEGEKAEQLSREEAAKSVLTGP